MQVPEFRCASLDELRHHADQFTLELGFESYGLVVELRATEAPSSDRLQFLTNTDPAWQASIANALLLGEAHNLVRHATLQLPPVGWSASGDLAGHTIVDDLALEHVRRMREWPVRAGVLCPVSAPELAWGAMVFFSPKLLTFAELDRALPLCSLYALNFSFWYMQIAHRRLQDRRSILSQRETECLSHAALGRTSSEIGNLLRISARTVEGYIATACTKLDSRGRQAAISRACELNLLGAPLPVAGRPRLRAR